MRQWIRLFEKQDDRDMEQKLRDLINHPSTEPHLRDVAQRKLDKLLAQKHAEEEKAKGIENLPALNLQISYGWNERDMKPLPMTDWDKVYLRGNGKTLLYRTVIERALPLRPFRIDFSTSTHPLTGRHVYLYFHPEDEPENGEYIEKVMNAGKTIWAGVPPGDGQYFRGGQSRYFVSFSRYDESRTKPRRK